MSVRTTETAIKAILGSHYDGTSELQPFIDTATLLVDDIAGSDESISLARLERIECYLSAHYYSLKDPIVQSRSTGRASGQFQGRTDLGFDGSRYGQEAKRLDPTGYLVRLDQPQRPKASCMWLGKVPSDQLSAMERST